MVRLPIPITVAVFLCLAAFLAPPADADDIAQPKVRPKRGRHLDIRMDRYTHDFGFVKQGSKHKTTFRYTNTSDRTVKGLKSRGECGCNVTALSHTELAPGESGTLDVEFSTHTLGGRLRKSIRLTSEHYRRGEIRIELEIAILAGLVVRPASLMFGKVAHGTTPTKSVKLFWYEGHGKPFQVTESVVPGYEKDFTVVVKRWKHETDPKWKGWLVEVTLPKTLPIGMFSAEMIVRTDAEARKRVDLALNADVVGKIWFQSRSFSFGEYRHGQAKASQSTIKIKPYAKDVVIREPRVVARKGKVIVKVIPDPYMAKAGMWKLIATIAPDAPPGSLQDEIVELHSGVPGEEVTLLRVRGNVRAALTPAKDTPADGR